MERDLKRIRTAPELRRQVAQVMQGNAWQAVLKEMSVMEVIAAEQQMPDFSEWMQRRNVWNALFRYKVAQLVPSDKLSFPQIGLNARWNCLAWYFALMGSCEEELEGYWIRDIKRPSPGGEGRLNFQKVIEYTGDRLNGVEPQLIQVDINAPDAQRVVQHLIDFVTNKQYRTLRSQVVWKVETVGDYLKSVAQILYVLLQEGFFIGVAYKEDVSERSNYVRESV